VDDAEWGGLVGDGWRRPGSAALVLVDGATPLRPEPALFEAMLEGWRRQSRRLSGSLIDGRQRVVHRFAEFTGAWPWQWTPAQVEAWTASGGWAHSTVRSYQGALAMFLAYVCDPRYGWVAECEQRVAARPVQVCHADNTAVHVADHEGRPERRPLTRVELQSFFDAADDQGTRMWVGLKRPRHLRRHGRPGAQQPATLAWGR
jgi:integrase/recombinase XerC